MLIRLGFMPSSFMSFEKNHTVSDYYHVYAVTACRSSSNPIVFSCSIMIVALCSKVLRTLDLFGCFDELVSYRQNPRIKV